MAEWSIAAVLKTVEGHTSGGSNPSLSAIKPDYQAFVVYTPNFTPCFGREIGCFVWGLKLKGRKEGNKNFYSPFCSFQKEGIRLYTHFSLEPYGKPRLG